tara:strand:+ start:3488 stop:4348 length:861 start_codon:yes stop_codon:yes gene_type:complete
MPTIADHILDIDAPSYIRAGTSRLHDCDEFNPYRVKDNDLIFVKTDFIVNQYFQNNVLDKLYKKFNIISGVSSYHLGRDDAGSYKYILEHPNLNKWICTNAPVEKHPKIIPIPIGFQEPDRPGGNQALLGEVHKSHTVFEDKKDMIFLPYHTPSTNPKRRQMIDYLKSLPFVVHQKEKQSLKEYYRSMDQYKFVIGLEGRGPDIHRNYETMLVGSIPINIKNSIKGVFEHHDAVGIFLDSWENLNEILLDKLLRTGYNTSKNKSFLRLENHIAYIKRIIGKDGRPS